jgi:hypothetical protein
MSHRIRPLSPALFWLVLPVLGACGDDGGSGGERPRAFDATVAPIAVDAGAGPEAGCASGAVQTCTCPEGGEGEQRCSNGVFSASCEGCGPAVVVDTTTKCVAGRYVGVLDIPYYAPGPAGLCGLVTLFGGGGSGAMAFTLGVSDNAEFASVIGSSSCLDVRVVGQSDPNVPLPEAGVEVLPDGGVARILSMELSGSVDCRTGKFSGEVKGTYRSVSFCDLGMMENDYFMKGPVAAVFDPVKRAFVDGSLDLKEPPVLLALGGEAGGKGSWSAALDRDAGTPPAPAQGCLGGVQFRDDLFP